ncbi:MAG TPA: hypothetical protein QF624_02235 [Dehalococcoidia bacterium]|nr:hypothetical protein [Dehalococcoidia bacterium]
MVFNTPGPENYDPHAMKAEHARKGEHISRGNQTIWHDIWYLLGRVVRVFRRPKRRSSL